MVESWRLLERYVEAGVLRPYDLSAKLREKHDEEVKKWREARTNSQ